MRQVVKEMWMVRLSGSEEGWKEDETDVKARRERTVIKKILMHRPFSHAPFKKKKFSLTHERSVNSAFPRRVFLRH